jgi:hypothetical protein
MRRLAAMFVLVPMALLGATAAAQPPQIDDLPPLPPAPRGADKAVFDVIVEGQGDAYRRVDGEGSNGLCQISSGTATTEVYEYGRGRGLRVVFTRLSRRAILMQRAGRRSPLVTFNVRGSVTSAAEGEASRSGPVPCAATTEKVGDEAGCGRKARAIDYGLAYARGELTLALAGDVTPPLPSPKLCGANGVESMSGPPVYGWFGPPELKPGELPPRKIFGNKRAFRVSLRAENVRKQFDSPNPAFGLRALEMADHRAIVRFVRVQGDGG